MKKKFLNGLLLVAFVVSSMNVFVSCKDYDEDVYTDLRGQIANLDKSKADASLITSLQNQINDLIAFKTLMENTLEQYKCGCGTMGYLTTSDLVTYLKDNGYVPGGGGTTPGTSGLTQEEADKLYLKLTEYKDYGDSINAHRAVLDLLQQAIDAINKRLDGISSGVDLTRLDSVVNAMSSMNITINNAVSKAEEAKKLAEQIAGGDSCKCDLKPLQDAIEKLQQDVAGWNKQIEEVSKKAEDALALAEKDSVLIYRHKEILDSLIHVVDLLPRNPIGGTVDLSGIIKRINDIENTRYTKTEVNTLIGNLRKELNSLYGIANEALQRAINDSTWIKNLEGTVTTMNGQIITLRDSMKLVGGQIKTLDGRVIVLSDSVQILDGRVNTLTDSVQILENKINTVDGKVNTLTAKVGTLETRLDSVVNALPELSDRINKVNARVDSLANVVDSLSKEVDKLVEDIQQMVTDIKIQATQNPVIGYLNTPFNIRTSMLAIYYGKTLASWEFPSTVASQYVNGAEDFAMWTERNIQAIGALASVSGALKGSAGQTLVTKDGETGNAGTLYVTVNPANVDFTGKEIALKNSQDQAAPLTLSPLKQSDRVLTHSFTRAAQNGFYEAAATITEGDIENVKLDIDFSGLKETAKTMLKDKTKTSVIQFGASMLSAANIELPAYAAMASWTDKSKGTVHNIYSNYELAATAIKPLSFAFLNDFSISGIPGLSRVQNMVGQIIDKINISINLGLPDFAKYKGSITFTDVKLPTINDDMFRIHYYKHFTKADFDNKGELYGDDTERDLYFVVTNKEGQFAILQQDAATGTTKLIHVDKNGNKISDFTDNEAKAFGTYSMDFEIDVDINKTPEIKSTLQDIINDLNKQFGENSDLAKNITNLLNDVASLGNLDTKLNNSITDAKNDLKSQINGYISKIDSKLTQYFNRLPGLLHLAILASNGNKVGLLSQAKSMPTNANATTLTLVPTSYSLELVAPAYKKFVAVTDVFNADGSNADISKAKTANSNGTNLAKVMDSDNTCKITGEAGYIYEITYTAVDYFGKVAIKKYYVRF
jgi:predicted  nucleic acid-binding Zn-ribbon protein